MSQRHVTIACHARVYYIGLVFCIFRRRRNCYDASCNVGTTNFLLWFIYGSTDVVGGTDLVCTCTLASLLRTRSITYSEVSYVPIFIASSTHGNCAVGNFSARIGSNQTVPPVDLNFKYFFDE